MKPAMHGMVLAAKAVLAVALVTMGASTAAAQTQARQIAGRGMTELMNGKTGAAIAVFQQVEKQYPASPLGYLLEADATWWRIYYSTANLIDPDVFDVVTSYHTPYDARFEQLVGTAVSKAEANVEAHRDVARNDLYEGMAYALEARLAGLRARDLQTASAGRKMRTLLLNALQLNPNLTDAYAGIGLYNYFVDTLPAIVKMLRFLIGLPGGNRTLGLQQMAKAAQSGEFTRAETKFYLAKDYTRPNERQFAKALDLFQQLANEYPQNPFWKMMVASCHMRMGQNQRGKALYQQLLAETANRKSASRRAIHQQVAQALERLRSPGK